MIIRVRIGSFITSGSNLEIACRDTNGYIVFLDILNILEKDYLKYSTEAAFYQLTGFTTPFLEFDTDIEVDQNEVRVYPLRYQQLRETSQSYFDDVLTAWDSSSLFWDCETYTPFKDFTIAERREDMMISISATFFNDDYTTQGYLLLNDWGQIDKMSDQNLFEKSEPYPIQVINYYDERSMLIGFWKLIQYHRPRVVVDFNGKSYDIPYLLSRMKLHDINIPNLSLSTIPTSISNEYQSVMGQTREVQRIRSDGMLFVDLIHHMKLWFSLTPNHKLDTFSRFYAGDGKTGLSIAELFSAYETKDPKKLLAGAEYSMRDAIVLEEIWRSIRLIIEEAASSMGIDSDRITSFPEIKNICDELFWICKVPFQYQKGKEIKSAPKHIIAKHVYILTFQPKMLEDIQSINQEWAYVLARRLRYAPLKVLTKVYECLVEKKYIDRNNITRKLIPALRKLGTVIHYGNGTIYISSNEVPFYDGTEPVELLEGYINLPQLGKIIRRDDGSNQFFGTIAKQECGFIKKLFVYGFDYLMDKIEEIPEPDVHSVDRELLVFRKSISRDNDINDLYEIAYERTKKLLMDKGYRKQNLIIAENIPVSWIVTKEGAELYDANRNYDIDYQYYIDRWEEVEKFFVKV